MAPMDPMETGDGMSVEELRAWVYARVKAHAPTPPVTNAWPIRPPRRSKVKLYLAFAAGVVFGMAAGLYEAHAEPACTPQAKEVLCEQMAETAFDRCIAKMPRFDDTEATKESRLRFMWHCGYQAGIWKRRDP